MFDDFVALCFIILAVTVITCDVVFGIGATHALVVIMTSF